jgi:transposase-like protein
LRAGIRLDGPRSSSDAPQTSCLTGAVHAGGPTCAHCGNADPEKIGVLKGKTTRIGLKNCYACREQFTVKVGTVYESSHVPLHKWLQATFLMTSSKKGFGARPLHRVLGVTYKTAWFMAHRIRETMRMGNVRPLGSEGKALRSMRPTSAKKPARRCAKALRTSASPIGGLTAKPPRKPLRLGNEKLRRVLAKLLAGPRMR